MLTSLSIANYRSIMSLTLPLGALNLITGPNGSGKSNLYKALRLLAKTASGGVINSLAEEGGLHSTYWAGPETISDAMRRGDVEVQGTKRNNVMRLKLGFASDTFGYAISLGLPAPQQSAFAFDPEIKHECIFNGDYYRPASSLVERKGGVVKIRQGRQWEVISQHIPNYDSLFDSHADPASAAEVFHVREMIRSWRFYDHFRTDSDAPARKPQLGTRTPVLHHDGRDLAAALQTIIEIGDNEALDHAIEDAFPGCKLRVVTKDDGRFSLEFFQKGLLRPLTGAELSDGTLRFVLWIAALLTPRPPALMVLNEPETSLHPDLLPALARLIGHASQHSQIWVISHANRLINALNEHPACHSIALEKVLGQTEVQGQGMLDGPNWNWPE
ncbi:ATP-binding protein [Enterovibrio norvegicus FF-454]|uniref:ATP-binding protein n=1 Tax=Enterovibrio norvegicus FF-454 TaxID=1185651 RepID=A0A1E5CBH2_9GAMM|nr:AAA family ATPase [Enterovibrio norvegicus]OEE62848.1 ATP-binding protein [Enterovibrio norvegicus FF-454]